MSLALFNKLPEEIINNHIIPYTYCNQPPILLHDIRSFLSDYSLITSIYFTQYKVCVLLNDLIKTVNSIDNYVDCNETTQVKVFSRLNRLEGIDNENYNLWKYQYFNNISSDNVVPKIRTIIGLLTPRERTIFFNTFILEDLDE